MAWTQTVFPAVLGCAETVTLEMDTDADEPLPAFMTQVSKIGEPEFAVVAVA